MNMACNRELSFPISMEAKKSLYVSKLHAFDVIVSSAKNASTFKEFLANSNNGLRVCLNHSSPRAFSTQPNGKIYLHPNDSKRKYRFMGLPFSRNLHGYRPLAKFVPLKTIPEE